MRSKRLLATLLTAAALLTACRRETPAPRPPQPKPAAARDRGRAAIRLESDVTTFNPVLQSTDDDRIVLSYLYDPIVALDEQLNPVPAIAASWEITGDGRVYLLHLDPRATFSDGKPVLASDVVFTLNRIVSEESIQFASWFEDLDRKETRAVDDHTVRVVFRQARAAQLLAFNIGVIPEHVYGKGDFAKNNSVVGAGPYVLRTRDRGRSILLARREDYWRARPPLATVLFRVISDDAVAWRAVERGEVDLARVNNDLWFRLKDDPQISRKIDFFSVFLPSYNAVVWNLRDPLFQDSRVRRALAMSFDRRAVIERLYHGQARPVTGPFTPDQWANNPEITPIEFNPTAAAAIFRSAGWEDGDGDGVLDRAGVKFEFRLLVPAGNSAAREQSQVFQAALRELGIRMEITPLDDSAFFEQILKKNFEAAFVAWVNEPDPDPYSLFHSTQVPPTGFNVVGYQSAEADQLIDEARREPDRARRAELYHQFHELLARDQPYLWTVQVASKWAVNRRLHEVKPAPGLGLFLWYPGPFGWWADEGNGKFKIEN